MEAKKYKLYFFTIFILLVLHLSDLLNLHPPYSICSDDLHVIYIERHFTPSNKNAKTTGLFGLDSRSKHTNPWTSLNLKLKTMSSILDHGRKNDLLEQQGGFLSIGPLHVLTRNTQVLSLCFSM